MVKSCVAFGCTNRIGKVDKEGRKLNLPFHGFPFSRPELLQKWILAVKRVNWTPSAHSHLCGIHFTEEDYQPTSGLRKLKTTAYPTIFDFFPHSTQIKRKENSDATSSKGISTKKRKTNSESDSIILTKQKLMIGQDEDYKRVRETLCSFAEPLTPEKSPGTRSSINISNNSTSKDSTNQSILSDSIPSKTTETNTKLVQSSKGSTTSNNHTSNPFNATTLPIILNVFAKVKSEDKDLFELFGEYIAGKMRKLDPNSCAHVQKGIIELIKDAEEGSYLSSSDDL